MEARDGTAELAPSPACAAQAGSAGARAQERAGVLFALACAVNGAFVPAVAKITTKEVGGLAVALLTTMLAAAVASGVLLVRGGWREWWASERRLALILLGVLGTGVSFSLFFTGAKQASAIETVLCLQIEPVYSLLLAWGVLGHRPTRRRVVATALILLGLALALGVERLPASSGIGYLLLTPLCWQLSHLIVLRQLAPVRVEVLTAGRYLWGTAALAVWFLLQAPPTPVLASVPAYAWPWLALQGAVLSYGGTLMWYAAVRRIDLARATVLVVPTVPLLSLVVSFALLREVPTLQQLVGVLLTTAGVYAFAQRGVAERAG